jgi:hypothetical protein
VVALDSSNTLRPDKLNGGGFSGGLHFSLVGFIAIACALVSLVTMAAHGFDENGLRLGSEAAWRFAFFAFFVALIAEPLGHLIPLAPMRSLGEHRRQLLWGFCASFAVYLATVVVPNTIRPVTVHHEGLTPGMLVFVIFGAALVAVLAYSLSRQARSFLGEPGRRAILTTGIAYFWLAYSLTGLSHISGPHRPDVYYGLSLSLMVVALLLRFADHFVRKLRLQRSGKPDRV